MDVILFYGENDQGLMQIFNHSIDFELLDKFNILNQKFNINDLLKECKIDKTISTEIYGEWIKQIQDSNRSIYEGKLITVKIFYSESNYIFNSIFSIFGWKMK